MLVFFWKMQRYFSVVKSGILNEELYEGTTFRGPMLWTKSLIKALAGELNLYVSIISLGNKQMDGDMLIND